MSKFYAKKDVEFIYDEEKVFCKILKESDDLSNVEVGDWVGGVGEILSIGERDCVRKLGYLKISPEMKAYMLLQECCGIKKGDKVKVLRKAKDFELGWGRGWFQFMDKAIGNVYDVVNVDDRNYGVCLVVKDENSFVESHWFPFFVLEKVGKENNKRK